MLFGLCLPDSGQAQGLLDIGPSMVEDIDIPLTGSWSSSLGWDSDAGSRDTGLRGRGSSSPSGESAVWQNSLDLSYGMKMRGRNSLSFGGNYTNLWYFDPPPGVDDMDHNVRVSMRYSRQVSRRLTVSNTAYVSYENDPNYDIGISVTRPTSGYFLASNRLSGSYQWSDRFSTVTGYTLSTILYEEDTLDNESYLRHSLSQQFRYSFKRRLTGTLSYRFGFTDYEDNEEAGSVTHSVLTGVDYAWNRRLSVSASAGVDYRIYDDELDDQLAPRVEVALGYILAKRTSARWVHMLSLDDTGRAGEQSGYSYRTSLSLSHGFTRRLNGSLSLSYVHSDYSDGLDDVPDDTEDSFFGSVSVGYALWRNVSLTSSYSYSFVTSDDESDDYRRHRVFFGIRYVF